MKRVLIICLITIPAFIWGIWFALPKNSLESFIEKSVTSSELNVDIEGLKKGLFYNFTVNRVTLIGRKGDLFYLRDLSFLIRPWSIAFIRLSISFAGDISGGNVNGKVDIVRDDRRISLNFKDAKIRDMPFLKIAGIQASGSISGRFAMNDSIGLLEFFSKDINFERAIFAGTDIPLNYFQKVIGSINIRDKEFFINSVTLEGNDIYARIKGNIKNAHYDMNLELMPGKSFADNDLFLRTFEKYEVSPGYYVIPLRGKL